MEKICYREKREQLKPFPETHSNFQASQLQGLAVLPLSTYIPIPVLVCLWDSIMLLQFSYPI